MAVFSKDKSFNYILNTVFAALILFSCSKSQNLLISSGSQSGSQQTIILVPGFKSSILGTRNGGPVWITASQSIFGGMSLTLPNSDIGTQNIELVDQGLLKKVSFIPGIYSYDILSTFLQRLNDDFFSRAKIVEFHYDWRKDNINPIRALATLIDKESADGSSITLIGHSMGGLIVSYYLRYGGQDFETAKESWEGLNKVDKVVLAGTPFSGALQMFHDMQTGSKTALNSSLLSAEALSSFPASYQLLPINQAIIADSKKWEQYSWGLFQDKEELPSNIIRGREQFVKANLTRAQMFLSKLTAPSFDIPKSHPKLLSITGQGRTTPFKLAAEGIEKEISFNDVINGDGDGVVPTESSQLPGAFREAFSVTDLRSDATHEALLSDRDTYQELKSFLKGR